MSVGYKIRAACCSDLRRELERCARARRDVVDVFEMNLSRKEKVSINCFVEAGPHIRRCLR